MVRGVMRSKISVGVGGVQCAGEQEQMADAMKKEDDREEEISKTCR